MPRQRHSHQGPAQQSALRCLLKWADKILGQITWLSPAQCLHVGQWAVPQLCASTQVEGDWKGTLWKCSSSSGREFCQPEALETRDTDRLEDTCSVFFSSPLRPVQSSAQCSVLLCSQFWDFSEVLCVFLRLLWLNELWAQKRWPENMGSCLAEMHCLQSCAHTALEAQPCAGIDPASLSRGGSEVVVAWNVCDWYHHVCARNRHTNSLPAQGALPHLWCQTQPTALFHDQKVVCVVLAAHRSSIQSFS